jgi:hypothetical protein
MADILQTIELYSLSGTPEHAELTGHKLAVRAYIDTGAGRTILSARVARQLSLVRAPFAVEYEVPIKIRVRSVLVGVRMLANGCSRKPRPALVSVSDAIIDKLKLPGVEVLVGQDVLQDAQVRLDTHRKGAAVSCRR